MSAVRDPDRRAVLAPGAVTAPDGDVGTVVRAMAVIADLAGGPVSLDPAALAAAPDVLLSRAPDGRVTIEIRRRPPKGKDIVMPL